MALKLNQKWNSGEGSIGKDGADTLIAQIYGDPVTDNADDPATVQVFAASQFPVYSAMGNILQGIARQRLAPGWWLFTGSYKSPAAAPQTGEAKFSFKTGSGTQKIYTARKHVADYAPSGVTPPNFHGAINVTDDSVEGVDLDVDAFAFDITFYVDPRNMSDDYCSLLSTLAKHVNSDTVSISIDGISLTFQPGELKYLESNGSKRIGFGDLELTLSFAASRNATDIMIGDTGTGTGTGTGTDSGPGPIGPITKKGWDYLWVRFQQINDTAAKRLVHRPTSAHVEEIYLYAALSPLFGTSGQGPDGTGTGTGTSTGPPRPPWTDPTLPEGGGDFPGF